MNSVAAYPSAILWAGLLWGVCGCARSVSPEVVVYVAVDRRDAEPLLHDFERDTGIRVRALYDTEAAKTTGLVSRLVAEQTRPQCDVFWNNELAQTLMLCQENLLADYSSSEADRIPATYRDKQGRWTSLALRARVLVYNTRYVKAEDAPQSILDLADPRWRGKCAIANPQFGTTRSHVAALYAALGPDKTQEWLQNLKRNDVRIVDGNAMVKNLVARAHPEASPIWVGLTDTDDVESGKRDGEPVELVFPDQKTWGTLLIPSTVSCIRGGPHPETAHQLVDYLLSPRGQTAFLSSTRGFVALLGEDESGGFPGVRGMKVDTEELLQQLHPSTEWVRKHFLP